MKFPYVPAPVLISLAGAVFSCFVFIIFLFYSGGHVLKAEQPPVQPAPTLQLPEGALSAKAAILYDPTTGKILYDKNSQLTLPLASITKLMTAHVVLNSMPTSTLITLNAKDTLGGSDAGDWGLKIGDVLRIGDLIKIGLAASSNYAMAAAAGSLGNGYISDMNRDATQLGLSHTYFLNPTGLDINTDTSGGYGSAYDIARLTAAFLKEYPQYFELSSEPSVSVQASGHAVTADATALPLQDIPGFIGAKTGYTDLAGGNLVMAYDIDIGHPLIAVVLGSTEEGRFTDIRTIVDASRALNSTKNL
jgi:D-alanyl-D-alanine carboxypeptidase (penicillin-binding protein 5/6)